MWSRRHPASLAQYTTDGFTHAAAAVAQQADPAVILLGQTNIGRDLGPALAHKLGTAVAMDTIAMEMKDGKLHTTRPAYGGLIGMRPRLGFSVKMPHQAAGSRSEPPMSVPTCSGP